MQRGVNRRPNMEWISPLRKATEMLSRYELAPYCIAELVEDA